MADSREGGGRALRLKDRERDWGARMGQNRGKPAYPCPDNPGRRRLLKMLSRLNESQRTSGVGVGGCDISVDSEDFGSITVPNAHLTWKGRHETQRDLCRRSGLLNASRGNWGGGSLPVAGTPLQKLPAHNEVRRDEIRTVAASGKRQGRTFGGRER